MIKTRIDRFFNIFLPLSIGFISFFLVVGPRALDVQNISWLGSGDASTHYLGWLFYRNSPWNTPIGLNPNYGLDIGSSIVYSDSLPIAAIFFKSIASYLPNTFQYFGIWLLICFCFQAYFGYKIISFFSDDKIIRALGACIIVFSPPFLARFGHLALSGHFLILWAFCIILSKKEAIRPFSWAILILLSASIHAYLLAMIFLLFIGDTADRLFNKKISASRVFSSFSIIMVLLLLESWELGYFGLGKSISTSEFGWARMNVLSLIDANSWSYVLKDIPGGPGDYEGFNFLGLGVLFLSTGIIFHLLANELNINFLKKDRLFIILVLFFMTIFSISNNIGIASLDITIPLPSRAKMALGLFRSSGRFFWPVFYAIEILIIYFSIKNRKTCAARLLLAIALLIQIIDSSAGWLPARKAFMAPPSTTWETKLNSPLWNAVLANKLYIKAIPPLSAGDNWRDIAYLAGIRHIGTDAVYLARYSDSAVVAARAAEEKIINEGKANANTVYILDKASYDKLQKNRLAREDFISNIDNLFIWAPKN